MRTHKWWLLLALSVIGLTWLPVYGVENESATSHDSQGVTQEAAGHGSDSLSSDQVPTSDSEGMVAPSPEMTLVQQLEARIKELDEKTTELTAEEQRLETLRQDLEALAREHGQAIAEVAKLRETKKEQKTIDPSQQSLEHLIRVYDAMDPEDAALRLEKMKEPLALDILAGIKEKKAASMLAGVEPVKAARLTEGLRNYGQKKTAKP